MRKGGINFRTTVTNEEQANFEMIALGAEMRGLYRNGIFRGVNGWLSTSLSCRPVTLGEECFGLTGVELGRRTGNLAILE